MPLRHLSAAATGEEIVAILSSYGFVVVDRLVASALAQVGRAGQSGQHDSDETP